MKDHIQSPNSIVEVMVEKGGGSSFQAKPSASSIRAAVELHSGRDAYTDCTEYPVLTSETTHPQVAPHIFEPTEPINTMSLDPPTYLSSLRNNIRQRPIPWEGAVRAGTLTDDQLSKIRAVDKVRKEQRKQTIEDDLGTYRTLFLGGDGQPGILESAATAKRADVVQYILVLLGDLLDGIHYCLFQWPQYESLQNICRCPRTLESSF